MPNTFPSEAHYRPLCSPETGFSFMPNTSQPGGGWLWHFAQQKQLWAFIPCFLPSHCGQPHPSVFFLSPSISMVTHRLSYSESFVFVLTVNRTIINKARNEWYGGNFTRSKTKSTFMNVCNAYGKKHKWVTGVEQIEYIHRILSRPTHFSAKAQCTRDPDGQRCPSQLSLSGTLSMERTNKQWVSDFQEFVHRFSNLSFTLPALFVCVCVFTSLMLVLRLLSQQEKVDFDLIVHPPFYS